MRRRRVRRQWGNCFRTQCGEGRSREGEGQSLSPSSRRRIFSSAIVLEGRERVVRTTYFERFPQFPQFPKTPTGPSTFFDLFLFSVQPETILSIFTVGQGTSGSEGTEVVLREGDGEGRVRREDQRGVAFAPAEQL